MEWVKNNATKLNNKYFLIIIIIILICIFIYYYWNRHFRNSREGASFKKKGKQKISKNSEKKAKKIYNLINDRMPNMEYPDFEDILESNDIEVDDELALFTELKNIYVKTRGEVGLNKFASIIETTDS